MSEFSARDPAQPAFWDERIDALQGGDLDRKQALKVPASESTPVFAGREHGLVWRRR